MSNVVSLGKPCEYLVSRAARHRRAGRYDEAMTLLSRAKEQFGLREEIELEMARVYDEMDCEEEAERAYLRVVRLDGTHQALALFHLALSAAQRADLRRAMSYYERFTSIRDQKEVSAEAGALLGRQLREEIEQPLAMSRKGRARTLTRRAVERLQEGGTAAAQRTLRHALALRETAQGYTLLACCHLMRMQPDEAEACARRAHAMAPRRVQTMCVLADALAAQGKAREAKRMLYLASMRASSQEDLLAVAMESAKHGEESLTLRLTGRLLRREPYHTKAMMLRGCAMMNLGRHREASRLFGRLCGLLPEDTVSESYYRLARAQEPAQERLSLGVDVTRQEGVSRTMELIGLLYADPDALRADKAALRGACRLCAWAVRSPMAGPNVTTVALIVLGALNTQESRETLLDALTDPQLDDSFKTAILQVLTAREGFRPYEVDFGGRLVRLAAGSTSTQPARCAQAGQRIVQRASDALSPDYPDAPQMLLTLFLAYLERYGVPSGRGEEACAAALEYVYHLQAGRTVDLRRISSRCGVSVRLCALFARRLERVAQQCAEHNERSEEFP